LFSNRFSTNVQTLSDKDFRKAFDAANSDGWRKAVVEATLMFGKDVDARLGIFDTLHALLVCERLVVHGKWNVNYNPFPCVFPVTISTLNSAKFSLTLPSRTQLPNQRKLLSRINDGHFPFLKRPIVIFVQNSNQLPKQLKLLLGDLSHPPNRLVKSQVNWNILNKMC